MVKKNVCEETALAFILRSFEMQIVSSADLRRTLEEWRQAINHGKQGNVFDIVKVLSADASRQFEKNPSRGLSQAIKVRELVESRFLASG